MADEGRRRGRPTSIERDQLIAAARGIRTGDLALRTVARALAVPRTTVYNHVRRAEGLGALVLTSILDEYPLPKAEQVAGQPWSVQLEGFAVRQRAAAGAWLRFHDPEVHLTDAMLGLSNTSSGC